MDVNSFLKQFEAAFGPEWTRSVKREIEKNLGKEICEMARNGEKGKALYAVYVVNQEADTVEQPDYVIATGEESARYKVLHSKGVSDPDTLDVFVQYIGALKSKEE
jgi:hypothetical protein